MNDDYPNVEMHGGPFDGYAAAFGSDVLAVVVYRDRARECLDWWPADDAKGRTMPSADVLGYYVRSANGRRLEWAPVPADALA